MAPPPLPVVKQLGLAGPQFSPLANGLRALHSLNRNKHPCLWLCGFGGLCMCPHDVSLHLVALLLRFHVASSGPPPQPHRLQTHQASSGPQVCICCAFLESSSYIHPRLRASPSYCLLTRQPPPAITLPPFLFLLLSTLFKHNIDIEGPKS